MVISFSAIASLQRFTFHVRKKAHRRAEASSRVFEQKHRHRQEFDFLSREGAENNGGHLSNSRSSIVLVMLEADMEHTCSTANEKCLAPESKAWALRAKALREGSTGTMVT